MLVSSPRQTILVVEDDADLRRMFRTALSFAGFDVREAGDGYSALSLIEQDPPEGIVLDLGLPTVSGHAVLQELAATAHIRKIPVVVVTGMPGEHAYAHVACVLRKPVTPDRLVNTLRACLVAGSPDLLS